MIFLGDLRGRRAKTQSSQGHERSLGDEWKIVETKTYPRQDASRAVSINCTDVQSQSSLHDANGS